MKNTDVEVIRVIRTNKKRGMSDFSKKMVFDTRPLLWIISIGGLLLAAYSIYKGYIGSLPWLSTMVGLPWAAHGTICSFYLDMAKSDHKVGGITFEAAKAKGFQNPTTADSCVGSAESPGI